MIANASQQSRGAARGRVRARVETAATLGLDGDERTGENPPSNNPTVAVTSAASQSQKPGSGPCAKPVIANPGMQTRSTVNVVIPSASPNTFRADLPANMAMNGAATTSAL